MIQRMAGRDTAVNGAITIESGCFQVMIKIHDGFAFKGFFNFLKGFGDLYLYLILSFSSLKKIVGAFFSLEIILIWFIPF